MKTNFREQRETLIPKTWTNEYIHSTPAAEPSQFTHTHTANWKDRKQPKKARKQIVGYRLQFQGAVYMVCERMPRLLTQSEGVEHHLAARRCGNAH